MSDESLLRELQEVVVPALRTELGHAHAQKIALQQRLNDCQSQLDAARATLRVRELENADLREQLASRSVKAAQAFVRVVKSVIAKSRE